MTYSIRTIQNENTSIIKDFSTNDFSKIVNLLWLDDAFLNEFEILEDGKWIGNDQDVNILEYYGYDITPENIKNKLITMQ